MNFYSSRSRYPGFIFHIFWYYYYLDSSRIVEDFGCKISKSGVFLKNNKRTDAFFPEEDAFKMQDAIAKRILNDDNYLDVIIKDFSKNSNAILEFIKKNENIENEDLTFEEIVSLYDEYNKIFIELSYPVLLLVVLSMSDVLAKEIKFIIIDNQDFYELIKSERMPYLLQYELDILNNDVSFAKELFKKWYWIPFDYCGVDEWDIDHFVMELSKPKDNEKKEELLNYKNNIRKNTNDIIKKYNLDEKDVMLIKAIKNLNYLQDERKRVTNMAYPFLQKKIFKFLFLKTKIPVEDLWTMTPEEIRNSFDLKDKNKYKHRKEESAFEVHNGEVLAFDKIPDYLNVPEINIDVKSVKGVPASKGCVRGKVRICNSSRDVEKMKDGEILFSPTTTPDYILGFKKAIAVVTDEGGLTCHAAVVSREMGLPCVIGTKIATQIFKDGDIVEVDADNGIVRKI